MKLYIDYITYYLKAKGKHGIHSPFVYDFVEKCISKPIEKVDLDIVKKWKSQLISDQRELSIRDFGVGSKKLGLHRKVAQIYKVSSSGKKYGKLLYNIARFYTPSKILEFGTSLGTGTLHLHLGHKDARITTIEGCPETAKVAFEHLNRTVSSSNLNIINQAFEKAFVEIEGKYDLVFIDGHHQSAAILSLLQKLQPHIHDETFLIIDDIRWSNDMYLLWKTVINDNNFHLTMDLGRMGIIAKRHHQRKEHFVIRY